MDVDRAKVISDKTIKVIEKKLDNELNKWWIDYTPPTH